MLLNLEEFKKKNKLECAKYIWKMEDDIIDKLESLAKENETRNGIIVRYIIDWACDEMEANEEFRVHMQQITMERNLNVGKKVRCYLIPNQTQEKLMYVKNKYRLYNISHFANESIRIFFNTNS